MPNANWSNPTLTSTYTNFVSEVKNRDEDLALQFDGTTSTNIPVGAIRWDSSANRWKKWNGSSWVELTSTYALTALTTTGSVGIGTSSPNEKLDVSSGTSGTAAVVKIQDPGGRVVQIASPSASTDAYIGTTTNHRLDFYTNNGVKATLDQLGRLGIGTTSPLTKLDVRSGVITAGSNSSSHGTEILRGYYSDTDGALAVIGTEYSSGGIIIGYAVKPSTSSTGAFFSSTNINIARGAYTIAGNVHKWYIGSAQTVAENNSVSTSEVMRIDSSGRLGIGTTSPVSSLHVAGTTTAYGNGLVPFRWGDTSTLGTLTYSGSDPIIQTNTGNILFWQGTTERARIDSSGRLLVGTSSVAATGSVFIQGNSGGSTGAGYLNLQRGQAAGASIGAGSLLGLIQFTDSSSNTFAQIYVEGDAASGINDYPGRLVFSTTADGASSPTERMRIDSSGRLGIGTSSPTALLHVNGDAIVRSLNGGAIAGTRNRIINGDMRIDQRNAGASQTFTAAAALAYSVDRFYAYCTGANVTGEQVAGATAGQYRYRFTGAASVTGIGFGQRIEQLNSADLAGATATLSVDLANSVLTTVTWTAFYATTADSFGTRASPTRTQIATGTFTVNSTVTRYSTQISVPAAATTGIEIVFTVGAQTSGTWTIGNLQLEHGSVATPFERRSYGQELALCQRYYGENAVTYFPNNVAMMQFFKSSMRVSPTVTWAGAGGTISSITTESFIGVSSSNNNAKSTASAEL